MIEFKSLVLETDLKTPINQPCTFKMTFLNQCLWICGENGSGKSTLLKSLAGVHSRWLGELIHSYDQWAIAYLPQVHQLFFHFPVSLLDVIELVYGDTVSSEMLETQPYLSKDLTKAWNQASGGERQRALVAGTLLKKNSLTLLDEPFNHLDHRSITQMQKCLESFSSQNSLIVTSHDYPPTLSQEGFVQLKLHRADEVLGEFA